MTSDPPFLCLCSLGFCVSRAVAVVTKARDAIEPVVMTQVVTKAKEMGRRTKTDAPQALPPLPCAALTNEAAAFLVCLIPDLSRTYTQDGVCLTESGLCQLQSLSATATRRRKPKPKLKLKIINQNSVSVLQAPVDALSEHSRDEDMEDNRGTCPRPPHKVPLSWPGCLSQRPPVYFYREPTRVLPPSKGSIDSRAVHLMFLYYYFSLY